MLEGLDESKLAASRASTKADCIAGLAEAASFWNHKFLDKLLFLKMSFEQAKERYSFCMDRLTHLPEQDRVEALEAYARAGQFRENKTTAVQKRYVDWVKGDLDDLNNLPAGRDFLDAITIAGGPARDFSPEAILYIASHMTLGETLPVYFTSVTFRMKEYLENPNNQLAVIDERGVIRLGSFIRVHAMFLESPQENVEEEQLLAIAPEDLEEVEDEAPFSFEDIDGVPEESEENFQRTRRTRQRRNEE